MSYLDKSALRLVGTRPIRPDGVDKVTGRANFGADMTMPGMLWGRIKRSPHAHARIVSINVDKALALPGVKAVVTRADFPDVPPERAHIGAAPHNLRDLSLQLHGQGQGALRGHAVAAVAATSPAIAEQALDLIEVEYEVLPHVIDVEAAMARRTRRSCTTTSSPPASSRSRPSRRTSPGVRFAKGDVEAGFKEADVVIERRYTTKPVHQGYIEPHACLVSVAADGQMHDLQLDPGPVHGARLHLAHLRRRDRRHPRDPGRDRRRLRRQDDHLSRAAGLHAVEEIRPAGQDGDEPRGGVPRHRPDLGRGHRGQARRQEGRPHHRRAGRAEIPGRRLPGLAGAPGLHVQPRGLRPAERRDVPATTSCATARRSPPTARPARRSAPSGSRARSTNSPRELGIDPLETARDQRRQGGHQGGARPDLGQYRLPEDAGGGPRQRAPEGAARPQPGARHRLGLLVQCRRRIERGAATSTRTARSPSPRATPISAARAPRWR